MGKPGRRGLTKDYKRMWITQDKRGKSGYEGTSKTNDKTNIILEKQSGARGNA